MHFLNVLMARNDGKYTLTHLDLSTQVGGEREMFPHPSSLFQDLSKVFAKDKCDFDDSLGGFEGNWCEICFYF